MQNLARFNIPPMILGSFQYPDKTISFRKPIILIPELDESQRLLVLEYPNINLHVFSETFEGLRADLYGMIESLWELYAKVPGETLTEDARDLKCRLLCYLREDPKR
jgi:hypothetical protein